MPDERSEGNAGNHRGQPRGGSCGDSAGNDGDTRGRNRAEGVADRKDIVGAASDFGGTFVDSMMKMIERAVVAAKREGVISDTHREEGAVAGAAHDAVCQVSEKAMGFPSAENRRRPLRRACGGRGVLYRGLGASQRGRRRHGTPGDLSLHKKVNKGDINAWC